jgi:uncharacterized protein
MKESTMTTGTDPAQVLREGHDAFNNRDRDRMLQCFADEITWHSPGDGPLSGTYEGRDHVWDQFFAPMWDSPLQVEDEQIVATDEFASSLTKLRAKLGDEDKTWKMFEVIHVADGAATERWVFVDRQEELDQLLEQASQQTSK